MSFAGIAGLLSDLHTTNASAVLTSAGGSMVLCQSLKALVKRSGHCGFWRRLFEPGGLPSAHAAVVTSLSLGMGLNYGWESVSFQMSTVFGGIVIYDALTLRRAVGEHARVLKALRQQLAPKLESGLRLPDALGHTPLEVIAGMLVGTAVVLGVLL